MSARRALVGWYLHHSGAGHRTRFDAVRRHLDADVVVFSTLAPPPALPSHTRWVMLDRDDQPERTESGVARDPAQSQPTAGGALHWAPLGHSGHASRLGMIAAALASERFDAFVVDVSVEVTLLVRLFGVPVVVMTQPGERNDDPHRLAFTAASRIVAPWPEALYVPRALEPFRAKTSFVGGISRFAGRRAVPPAVAAARATAAAPSATPTTTAAPGATMTPAAAPGATTTSTAAPGAMPATTAAPGATTTSTAPPGAMPTTAAAPATSVLVLGAGGGRTVTPADIEAAAVATGARPVAGGAEHAADGGAVDGGAVDGGATVAAAGATTWHALGMEPTAHVSAERWNADPFDLLQDADVVVSFAGQNAVADLASAGARAIVIAQPRAFDEQRATARVLQEHGLAVVRTSWPAPDEWPALLAEARALTPDWSAWRTPGAASRAAAAIADVATLSAPSAQPTQTTPLPPPAPATDTSAPVGDRNPENSRFAERRSGNSRGFDCHARGRSGGGAGVMESAAQERARGVGRGAEGIAVVTLFSAARLEHALNQFALLLGGTGPAPLIVGVWLDAAPAPEIEGVTIVCMPPSAPAAADAADPATPSTLKGRPDAGAPTAGAGAGSATACAAGPRLRLAAGRNAGAAAAQGAGARLLVFLDADCLPGPELLERYAEAAAEHPESVLCGPVTYLPEGARPRTAREFAAATAPHAARPNLPAGETRAAHDDEYRLFWSLSFACMDETWRDSGGFSELYEGYGAEDTDFASTLRERRIDLRWVGGAHAYHQYHPTSSPPWQHLDDILRNGALYNARWGSWPMQGWLAAFEEAGAIERVGGGWRRVLDAAGHPVDAARRDTAERDSRRLDTA